MKVGDQNHSLQIEKYLHSHNVNNPQQQVQQSDNRRSTVDVKETDTVELSSRSKLMNKVTKNMSAQEPERAERLQMIKEQVQAGTYRADAEKVANTMLKDLIKDLG